MVFDFSLALITSTSYQLPGTLEPRFQVSILTAPILMNRFHHLIPGFFSPIEFCVFSPHLSVHLLFWPTDILESRQMTYENQISQPDSHIPPPFSRMLYVQICLITSQESPAFSYPAPS